MVKKGQLLFLIQQNTYMANLQQAVGNVLAQEAQLVYAKNQLDRYSHLYPEKAASQTDVDNWQYQRDSAQANLKEAIAKRDLAKLDLSYTRVTAPFNGRIDRRLQDPGNLVGSSSSNTNLAQMGTRSTLSMFISLSAIRTFAQLMKSRHGIPGVSMRLPFFAGLVGEEGYPHQGYIDFASISVSDNTGTLPMRGVITNPAGIVLPGLYARVRVPVETRDVLLVPGTAIGNDQQGDYVLIVDEKNTVERRNVKTGPVEGDLRVVQEGLIGNERVVVRALLKAYPGSRVAPVWEKEPMRGNR